MIKNLADSIILATAKNFGAVLWTQDSDFQNIAGVKYFPKIYTMADCQYVAAGTHLRNTVKEIYEWVDHFPDGG